MQGAARSTLPDVFPVRAGDAAEKNEREEQEGPSPSCKIRKDPLNQGPPTLVQKVPLCLFVPLLLFLRPVTCCRMCRIGGRMPTRGTRRWR